LLNESSLRSEALHVEDTIFPKFMVNLKFTVMYKKK